MMSRIIYIQKNYLKIYKLYAEFHNFQNDYIKLLLCIPNLFDSIENIDINIMKKHKNIGVIHIL